MNADLKLLERFLSKVRPQKGRDACWLWAGAISSGPRGGYGYFTVASRVTPAHRVAWELWCGPIPEDLTVDHLCRVRNCVRPSHLRLATHRENCQAGHEARLAGEATSAPVEVTA